jgi:hypothetical protein
VIDDTAAEALALAELKLPSLFFLPPAKPQLTFLRLQLDFSLFTDSVTEPEAVLVEERPGIEMDIAGRAGMAGIEGMAGSEGLVRFERPRV